MKKTLLFVLFIGLFSNHVFARRIKVPVCFPCEKLELVKDLPNDENLKEGSDYLNLGYLYKEYSVVWIPAWNTKGKYVLINNDKTQYYEITEAQLSELKTKYNLKLSNNPLSFWKKIGGKIIYIILIGLVIWWKFSPDDEDEDEKKEEI